MSELPDVTTVPVAELLADDDTNLTQAIKRIVAELDDPDGVISAFQSYATP